MQMTSALTTLKALSTTSSAYTTRQGKILIDFISKHRYYESEVKGLPNWKVVFNFCKAIKPINTNCPNDTFAGLVNTNSNVTECYTLSKQNSPVKTIYDDKRDYNALNLSLNESIKSSDIKKGRLELVYQNSEPGCPLKTNSSNNSSLALIMVCDPKSIIPVVSEASFNTLCEATVIVRSS